MMEYNHLVDIAIVQVDNVVEDENLNNSIRLNHHDSLDGDRTFGIRVCSYHHYMWIHLNDMVVLKVINVV